jgi:hypothetical protein
MEAPFFQYAFLSDIKHVFVRSIHVDQWKHHFFNMHSLATANMFLYQGSIRVDQWKHHFFNCICSGGNTFLDQRSIRVDKWKHPTKFMKKPHEP